MSAARLLDELLSGFGKPGDGAFPASTSAKAANPANREHPCEFPADSRFANGLRTPANPGPLTAEAAPDSQTFAAESQDPSQREGEQSRDVSRDSQDSQVVTGPMQFDPAPWLSDSTTGDISAVPWTDGDISRFLDRRARMLRWGWTEPEAEAGAERLVKRDREPDDRVSCVDCRHYRPHRCGNHRQAGLHAPDVSRDLAGLLQRCPGFKATLTNPHVGMGHAAT